MTPTKNPPLKFDPVGSAAGVDLCDAVLWYDGDPQSSPPFPAIVTRLGMGTSLTLAVLTPDRNTLMVKDGVKCRADPTVRDDERTHAGVWDYHPKTKLLLDLAEKLKLLTEPAVAAPEKPKK